MFRREAARRVSLDCGDKLVTKQSHKDECDIHNILRQYSRTGIIAHVSKGMGEYIDLPDNIDYQQSINTLMEGQAAFAALPATVRDHFKNDPALFLGAFNDPAQAEYLRSVGLLQPLKPKPATPVAEQPAVASDG